MGLRQKDFSTAIKNKRQIAKRKRKSTVFDFNAIVWAKLLGSTP